MLHTATLATFSVEFPSIEKTSQVPMHMQLSKTHQEKTAPVSVAQPEELLCRSCSQPNPPGSAFCGECGHGLQMMTACPACQRTIAPGLRFCCACGSRVTIETLGTNAESNERPAFPRFLAAGRYRLQRLLGEGTSKRVYLAHDTLLNREVALALFKAECLTSTGRKRIQREARALGQLGQHAHIVTLYDAGEDAGQPYLVSQYIAGGSLAELLSHSPGQRLPLARALTLALQLCQALEAAHTCGIIHRDVKPSNVWLTTDGQVQLGDFGLAASLDQSRVSVEGMLIGTAAYLPPEHLQGQKLDARGDLYSLGALLYEMLSGRPPFVGDNFVSLIAQHLNSTPVAPSCHGAEIPPALDALVLQMLAKTPDERPQSAGIVATALQAIAEEHAASLAPPAQPTNAATSSNVPDPALGLQDASVFQRDGDAWLLSFQGVRCQLKHTRGLSYLAQLLAHPHQEFHALDLVACRTPEHEDTTGNKAGCTEVPLTPQARVAYKQHLQELREELDEAREFNDLGRVEKLEEAIEQLVRELTHVVGGGRQFRVGSAAERARVSVAMALKVVMNKIAHYHPPLNHHLICTIKTGTYCAYTPDPRVPVAWQM